MATPTRTGSDQPHLVTLVLQSKKALQHGEQLCSRASSLSSSSAQSAIDVLALDAKVKWLSAAVVEQLKLAATVAKSIDQKRAQLHDQAKEWDTLRNQHMDALDAVLESLGSQQVPHDFHSTSEDSSLFGSPSSDDGRKDTPDSAPEHSPAATVRTSRLPTSSPVDRSRWKTLRDFVDERTIEDAWEAIESHRGSLDDTLATTADYSETLTATIATIEEFLPEVAPLPPIDDVLSTQVKVSTDMASHLESLAAHYDQMAGALRESEAGEEFTENDIQAMNRDTDELPSIIRDLEESCSIIESSHDRLLAARNDAQRHITSHRSILDDLDELGEIMSQMLDRQQAVEAEFVEILDDLRERLVTIEDLQQKFTSYQLSYNKLLLEIGRRQQYRDAAENIVRGMMKQLTAMTEEERMLRTVFNTEQGSYLPGDICLAIRNMPTRWKIVSLHEDEYEGSRIMGSMYQDDYREDIPDVDYDLLAEARERINNAEVTVTEGSQSL